MLSEAVGAEINNLALATAQEDRESPFARSLTSELVRLRNDVEQVGEETKSDPASLQIRRLATLQQRSASLFSESLAIRLAPFIRSAIDARACALGDQLLMELARAVTLEIPHFTMISDSEYYGASTRIIRIRYPATIWDLPIVAHEFAHSFGPMWRAKSGAEPYPRDAFLGNKRIGSRLVNDEYFCDMVATFLLGPAYPAACIIGRFSPNTVEDTDTHPSDVKRAWWVLRGLELLAESMPDRTDSATCNNLAASLRSLWNEYLLAASTSDIDAVFATELEIAAQGLFSRLKADLPSAALSDLANVSGLIADYQTNVRHTRRFALSDLLNTTWLLRLRLGDSEEKIRSIQKWAISVTATQ